ncbi:MAG: hypothetical protein K0R14_1021 [Burkholderiales bacterium]|jgi:hypothetical protein|nr:hypothetical protein [Burkholderiales bacterium]
MKKIKLLFIIVLIFSSMMCFATIEEDAAAEETELREAVLNPIINHFPVKSSYTWRVSQAILEQEKSEKRQFDIDKAKEYLRELSEMPGFKDTDYNCIWKEITEMGDRDINGFVARTILAWQTKVIQCGGYADLAMLTFNFNMMNYKAQGISPIFKEAVYAVVVKDTGDHVLILVEGRSGTMFAVDPWIRNVIKLPNFPGLSNINFSNGKYYLKPQENKQLSSLFASADENGKLYYDVMFVDKYSNWVLDRMYSLKISCVARSGGPIKTMYEDLNLANAQFPKRVPWFPRWQLDYDRLIPSPAKKEPSPAKKDSSTCSLM